MIGIDVADHVGDRHIGRGELLDVPGIPLQPPDRRAVTVRGDPGAADAADRIQRIVVDLASGHHGNPLVEERDQRAQEACLRLPAQAEEDEIVLGEQRVDELGDDRIVVADDAAKEWFAAPQPFNEVLPDFLVHAAPRHGARVDGSAQIAQRGNRTGVGHT